MTTCTLFVLWVVPMVASLQGYDGPAYEARNTFERLIECKDAASAYTRPAVCLPSGMYPTMSKGAK
jgi:hypothetical protein